MSNIIQIKRGSGKPSNGVLLDGELGYDKTSGFLYIGNNNVIADIKVGEATKADKAQKIINSSGDLLTVGSTTSPIFLNNGVFSQCTGTTISGTTEKAVTLVNPRQISVNLGQGTFARFDGSQDITTGVSGTLPVTKGGTGATTAAAARTNLGITPANIGAAAADHTHSYLPLGGGTLSLGTITSNTTKWALEIDSSYGNAPNGQWPDGSNAPIGWASGIKFHVLSSNDHRYAAIEGYAATGWANQTGLRFTTKSSGGTSYEATFTEGYFKAPKFITEGYGTAAPSGTGKLGQLYFQVVN